MFSKLCQILSIRNSLDLPSFSLKNDSFYVSAQSARKSIGFAPKIRRHRHVNKIDVIPFINFWAAEGGKLSLTNSESLAFYF